MRNLYALRGRLVALIGAGLLISQLGHAQSVGVGTTTPHSSAALDVNSTGQGFLPPRMSQTQRDAIATPAAGLSIYNTDTQRVNVWDGTAWTEVLATKQFVGGGPGVTTTFAYTGSPQTYNVPAGVTTIQVTAEGSSGQNYFSVSGGLGARVTATLTVVPGEVLTVQVGGVTYNGGGSGTGAGAGGGATDLRRTGPSTGDYLSSRNALLVAGGGGGSSNFFSAVGGNGGTPAGTAGGDSNGGSGANQTGAGNGNGAVPGQAGTNGTGGNGNSSFGTGGAGGYYGGGGGGASGGGGGGSSWVMPTGSSNVTYTVMPTNALGSLTITTVVPTYPAPTLDASNFMNLPVPALSVSGQTLSLAGGNSVTLPTNTGPQGPQGPAGNDGATGPQGPAGTNGTNGTNATVTASNGVSVASGNVTLGGSLSQNTTIAQGGNTLSLTGGSVGIGTATPNPKAALDISATDKGLLIPRMTQAQRTAMTSVPVGLMVFQTDGSSPGFWYYFGSQWNAIPNMATVPGDNLGDHTATQNFNLGDHTLNASGFNTQVFINRGAPTGSPLNVVTLSTEAGTFAGFNAGGTKLTLSNGGSSTNSWEMTADRSSSTQRTLKFSNNFLGGPGAVFSGVGFSSGISLGLNTTTPAATLHVAGPTATMRVDGLAGPDTRMLTVNSVGDFVPQAMPVGDNLGNHLATQNITLNDQELRLRSVNDANYALAWYGAGKPWNGFLLDGPALYGWGGGILGTNRNGVRTTNLVWNSAGHVGIGTTNPDRPLTVQGSGTDSELISLKTAGGATKWHWNLYGGGLNLAETGVADNRIFVEDGGNVSIGGSNPAQRLEVMGHARVVGAVFANTITGVEYQTVSGPNEFADNTAHIVSCSPGWAITSLRAYASQHLDGRMRINCVNLNGIISTNSQFGLGGCCDGPGSHVARCPPGQVASTWAIYASSYLDGYMGLKCNDILPGFTRGAEFETTQVIGGGDINGLDNQFQGGACPTGSYLTEVFLWADTYLDSFQGIKCASIYAQ